MLQIQQIVGEGAHTIYMALLTTLVPPTLVITQLTAGIHILMNGMNTMTQGKFR